MSTVDDLKAQITAGKIKFDSDQQKKELLGDTTPAAKAKLQSLALELSKKVAGFIRISSVIHGGPSHHAAGRAIDIGNEDIANELLPKVATDAQVTLLEIDEIIFDAGVTGQNDRNKWNYDKSVKHNFDDGMLAEHNDHIHFSVKE